MQQVGQRRFSRELQLFGVADEQTHCCFFYAKFTLLFIKVACPNWMDSPELLKALLVSEREKTERYRIESERLNQALLEANRRCAALELVRLERDELARQCAESHRNEPLVKELDAARRMVDNQRQWMRCFLATRGLPHDESAASSTKQ